MKRRMNLSEAASLTGLTVSGIRARAKKNPTLYELERDNTGRLWVVLDPDALDSVKPAIQADAEGRVQVLEALLQEVRQDRDHWRRMAETLAAKRWRFWPF